MGTSQISPHSPPSTSSTLASSSSRYPPSTNDPSQRANATHFSPPAPSSATPLTPSRRPHRPYMIDVHS
jgi:hypothetical protein